MAAAIAGYAWVGPAPLPVRERTADHARVPGASESPILVTHTASSGVQFPEKNTDIARQTGMVAKLHLPAGACRLQPDAEGNVVGTCTLPSVAEPGTRVSPFGGNDWQRP